MVAPFARCGRAIVVLLGVLAATAPAQPAQAWCLWGFGQCTPANANPLVGEYALDGNPNARLIITASTITSALGPVSFTTDYVLKSVEGKDVTIEVSPLETKVTLRVQIEKDFIRIATKHMLAGDWKKKPATPQ